MAARPPAGGGAPLPVRPLPRLLAPTDDAILTADDFPIRTAAIAAAGPAVGIVVRSPGGDRAGRVAALERVRALAGPPEAAVLAADDPSLGAIGGVHGVLLPAGASVAEARRAVGPGWIGVAVRRTDEAAAAAAAGADWVVALDVFAPDAGPGRATEGLTWLGDLGACGVPVFASGGVTVERMVPVRDAGAWGVSTLALWRAPDSAKLTDQLLRVWNE